MKELSPYLLQHPVPSPGKDPAAFGGPVVEEGEGFGLRDHWRVIRKYRWLIATFFSGVVLTTAIAVFMMTPIYTAETTLLIERKAPQIVDIQQVLSEPLRPDEYDYYKTQYEILKSRSLVSQVIYKILKSRSRVGQVIREHGLEKSNPFSGEGPVASPLEVNPQVTKAYINDTLEIQPIQGTRLVNIAFSSPDPEFSAYVANAHADAYIRQRLELRTQANTEAQKFLQEKLVELKERVEKSEVALNHYRRDKGILSHDDKENIVVERLADLNRRLTGAEAERIQLEADAHLIRKRGYDSLPAVISSTLIQTLKGQLVRLEGEYANLSTQFKPGYPRVAQLKAQMEKTRRRLKQEIKRVVGGIESAYLAAEAKEKELRAKMKSQKAATLALKDASVNYAILAREVDTNRQLYDSVLGRMKEIGVAAELRASNVFVIDRAEPPLKPSSPKKTLSLLLSALVGVMGGVGLALFLDYLDNTLKTPEEVERYLGLPNLGVVPDFLSLNNGIHGYAPKPALSRAEGALRHALKKGVRVRRRGSVPNSQSRTPAKELVLSHHPLSVVNEAYRTLRTAILLSQAEEPPKTILFTSGTRGEGKTATVVNTAIIFAQMGVKVMVMDADLRRSSCHKVLRMEDGCGLTDLLTGQRELEKVIKTTPTDSLFLLSAGLTPPNPTELVGSKKMHETLTSLQEQYDYILIDSPPVMAVSDAVLLSTMVDGVVLVVNGQETPKHVAKAALSRLRYARGKVLGVVLNQVDMHSEEYAYYYPYTNGQ